MGRSLFIVTVPIHSSSFFPPTLSYQANTLPALLFPRTTMTSMSAQSDKIIFVLFYLTYQQNSKKFHFYLEGVLASLLVRVLWEIEPIQNWRYVSGERELYRHTHTTIVYMYRLIYDIRFGNTFSEALYIILLF